MKDIITLSFNTAELCILVVTTLVILIFIWLRIKEHITDYRTRLLTEINDDLERLHNDTNTSKNFSISAK